MEDWAVMFKFVLGGLDLMIHDKKVPKSLKLLIGQFALPHKIFSSSTSSSH